MLSNLSLVTFSEVFLLRQSSSTLSILVFLVLATASCGLLAAHTARAPTPEWGGEGEVDVLLRIDAHEERWDIADLLPDTDVALADERPGVVDGLGETKLEDLRLEAALHNLRGGEPKHVIELALVLEEQPESRHATQHCLALEHTRLALLVHGEQRPGGAANLRQRKLDAPHLALVLQTVLANDLHLPIEALFLKWALRLLEHLRVAPVALRRDRHFRLWYQRISPVSAPPGTTRERPSLARAKGQEG